MSDTSSSSTSAKHVATGHTPTTGSELEPRKAPIINIATGLETRPSVRSRDSIGPRELYEFYSKETARFEVDVPVALMSDAFSTSLQQLRSAIAEANELEKQ